MFATLRFIANFNDELVAGEGISHIVISVVALRWDVEEDQIGLLDERAFEFDPLCCLKTKLLLTLSFDFFALFLPLCELCTRF